MFTLCVSQEGTLVLDTSLEVHRLPECGGKFTNRSGMASSVIQPVTWVAVLLSSCRVRGRAEDSPVSFSSIPFGAALTPVHLRWTKRGPGHRKSCERCSTEPQMKALACPKPS